MPQLAELLETTVALPEWCRIASQSLPALKTKSGVLMTEERKHAILFAATLLAARKLMPVLEEETPNMGRDFWTTNYVNRAIEQAAKILEKIDERWPVEKKC